MNKIALLLALLSGLNLIAQSDLDGTTNSSISENKGKFYFFWGYNRATHGKSDIKMVGPDFNFTLKEVKAKDLPKDFSSIYYNPSKFTVPQFNFRIGYFISDKYSIAAGWDHMKYQTVNGSTATIDGYIGESASTIYAGNYDNQKIEMDHDNLVKMEHSDGFNVVNVNLERLDLLYSTKDEKFALELVTGAGIGFAVPWTNSFVFGARNDDRPHFSGMGAQVFIAPELLFFKHIFFRYTGQIGFAKMWDIAISPKSDNSDTHAEQTIRYFERSGVLGYRFRIGKK